MGVRDSFIERASSRKTVHFELDGVAMWLRPMAKGTRSKMETFASDEQRTPSKCSELRWIVLRECLVEEDGSYVLEESDKAKFDTWDDSFVEPIFEKVLKISKITETDKEEFLKN